MSDSKGQHIVVACRCREANWDVETSEVFAVYQGLKIALIGSMNQGGDDGIRFSEGCPSIAGKQMTNLCSSLYR